MSEANLLFEIIRLGKERDAAVNDAKAANARADRLELLLKRACYCLDISKLKSLDINLTDEIDAALEPPATTAGPGAGRAGEAA